MELLRSAFFINFSIFLSSLICCWFRRYSCRNHWNNKYYKCDVISNT